MKYRFSPKKFFILSEFLKMAHESMPTITAIMLAGYGANLRKIEWYRDHPPIMKNHDEIDLIEWRRGSKFMNEMKMNGLVTKNNRKEKGESITSYFVITEEGKRLLEFFRNKNILRKDYGKPKKINKKIVVAFDIPEKYKDKRNWLRSILKSLEFTQLQKSMWIGSSLLPEDFLKDIRTMGVSQYIKVIEVAKIIN